MRILSFSSNALDFDRYYVILTPQIALHTNISNANWVKNAKSKIILFKGRNIILFEIYFLRKIDTNIIKTYSNSGNRFA